MFLAPLPKRLFLPAPQSKVLATCSNFNSSSMKKILIFHLPFCKQCCQVLQKSGNLPGFLLPPLKYGRFGHIIYFLIQNMMQMFGCHTAYFFWGGEGSLPDTRHQTPPGNTVCKVVSGVFVRLSHLRLLALVQGRGK